MRHSITQNLLVAMNEMRNGYINHLKNKIFGILCEFEKNGNWERILDSVLIELMGIPDDERPIDFYTIYYKLSSARYLQHKYLRTNILDVMALLGRDEIDG